MCASDDFDRVSVSYSFVNIVDKLVYPSLIIPRRILLFYVKS